MVSDDGPGVDFVVGDEGPEPDEELAQPDPPRNPHLRRTLAGAAVLLVVGALIGRHVGTHHPSAAAAPSSTAATTAVPSAAPFTPPPDVISDDRVTVPEGNRPTFQRIQQVVACPADAVCDLTTTVPEGLLKALQDYLPGAQLRSAQSTLVNRRGRFGPDLLARHVTIRYGDHSITVDVRKPRSTDLDEQLQFDRGADTVTRVVVVSVAFTVTVESTEAHGRASLPFADLAELTNEPALVAPQ